MSAFHVVTSRSSVDAFARKQWTRRQTSGAQLEEGWKQKLLPKMDAQKLARLLGWVSVGLGTAEIVAPKHLAGFLGIDRQDMLLRFIGLREVGNGAALLAQSHTPRWLWSRVAGDAIDLALLTVATRSSRKRRNVGLAIATVAAITAIDLYGSLSMTEEREQMHGLGKVQEFEEEYRY